jgi:hypothetical protein
MEGPAGGFCPARGMEELTPLIPGIYADGKGRALLNMREFLAAHGLRDTLEMRAVIWEEIQEIFGDIEVIEMPGGPDSDVLDN